MSETFTLTPRSRREHVAVDRLGATGWAIVDRSQSVICLAGQPGLLMRKADHIRWMPASQVKPEPFPISTSA
jgi:hypothetical protein